MGEHRRWFSGGVGDGQAHYGEMAAGRVQAICGLAFNPLCSPLTGRIVATARPLDDRHGCRECLRALRDGHAPARTACGEFG